MADCPLYVFCFPIYPRLTIVLSLGLYLLWKIGIAHGDVSLSNMMYYEQDGKKYGVLNDFDLAAIMAVGERTPKKQGFERTGTLPFMALDLLKYPNGQISRWFRHDLESCMWCVVWQALARKQEHWYSDELTRISAEKYQMLGLLGISYLKEEWEPFTPFLVHWAESFRYRDEARQKLIKFLKINEERIKAWQDADGKAIDADFMRLDAQAGKNMMEIEGVEALEDLSWIEIAADALS